MPIPASDAAHLLRRAGYGVTSAELDRVRTSPTRVKAVDRVLQLGEDPADPVPTVADGTTAFADWWKVTSWWLERMRTSPVGIVEKMTLLWHDHFVSGLDKCNSIELLVQQHRTLRRHALGDFHALTQDVAVDPAMLIYLDNWLNWSHGPQENFARELLELFTVGVGHYDENDVGELARAWTGFSLTGDFRSHHFYPQYHDAGPKAIFGLPPRAWTGPETITEILRGTKSVAASEFIVAKVFSHLAYPISPGEAPVPQLATGFRKSGLDIRTLVRDIFRSDAFWSARARYAVVRSPIEWMVASLKALDLPVADVVNPFDLAGMGQLPFSHPDVDGWGTDEYWISTGASWTRAAWAARVRWHSYYSGVFSGLGGGRPDEIAAAGFERFGIVDPSAHTRSVIENWASTSKATGDASLIPLNLPLLMMLTPEFQVA